MVGNLIFKVQTTEPAIGKMQLRLLAQSTLRADAVAVAHDEHPQHQLRIDGGPTDLAVKGLQLLAKLHQNLGDDRVDPAKQMARRNAIFQLEQVEKSIL